MNEIRASHLVERAAMRLRDGLGLSGPASPDAALPDAVPPDAGLPDVAPSDAALPDVVVRGTDAPHIVSRVALAPDRTIGAAAAPPAAAAPRVSQAALSAAHEPVSMAVLQRAGVALGAARRTRIAEEFSVTAGALLRALRAAQAEATGGPGRPAGAASAETALANLLLVTSAKPGEGKSFSSLNLAATLAHHGLARVVLVDIDPKPGSLTALLGLQDRQGLFDLAADAALRPDSVLAPTAIRDLSVLPLGTRPPDASGQGLTRSLAMALERVARRSAGQVVILDAPPCLATSEPAALAPMVGLVAMVVESERTQREEVEHALDMVRTCPSVMLLLNKIRGAGGHAFGDYDYYGA